MDFAPAYQVLSRLLALDTEIPLINCALPHSWHVFKPRRVVTSGASLGVSFGPKRHARVPEKFVWK